MQEGAENQFAKKEVERAGGGKTAGKNFPLDEAKCSLQKGDRGMVCLYTKRAGTGSVAEWERDPGA